MKKLNKVGSHTSQRANRANIPDLLFLFISIHFLSFFFPESTFPSWFQRTSSNVQVNSLCIWGKMVQFGSYHPFISANCFHGGERLGASTTAKGFGDAHCPFFPPVAFSHQLVFLFIYPVGKWENIYLHYRYESRKTECPCLVCNCGKELMLLWWRNGFRQVWWRWDLGKGNVAVTLQTLGTARWAGHSGGWILFCPRAPKF